MEKAELFKPVGVYPAILTPYDHNGDIHEEHLRKLIRWLIREGVDGLFPLGSVGEFVHLSLKEKATVIKVIVDEAKGKVPVVPGTAGTCPKNCIANTKMARDLGCSGAVIAPPYYYPLPQDMIESHYREIAEAVPDFPILLYNIPLFATPLSYHVVHRLSKLSNVVGMKDSSGSMIDLLNFIKETWEVEGGFHVLVGREEVLFSGLTVGAKGTMSATVGVVPEVMIGIYKAWGEGNMEKAKELQLSMVELARLMFLLPFPLGFRAVLEVRGFTMGKPKQPFSGGTQNEYEAIKNKLEVLLKEMLGDQVLVIC